MELSKPMIFCEHKVQETLTFNSRNGNERLLGAINVLASHPPPHVFTTLITSFGGYSTAKETLLMIIMRVPLLGRWNDLH